MSYQMKAIHTNFIVYCTLITWVALMFYWLLSGAIKQMSQLILESPTEGIKKGSVVKMSATLLLLINSLCQMLDTACVSRVLLKNDCICTTKADGFRVLRRKGGVGGLKGGMRQTGTLGQTHWDRWLSPSKETWNSAGHAGYWKRGTGWGVWTRFGADLATHGVCSQITQRDFLLWWKMGILQFRVKQWLRTWTQEIL